MHDLKDRRSTFYYFALFLILGPWIYLQSQIRIPADAAWLISAAEHILNGQSLSQYYFDTNPPLCFLIYIPAVWLENMGLHNWQALHIYTVVLGLISLAFVIRFLQEYALENITRQTIIIFYALGIFCFAFLEYGQKDHLIGIALLPFLLAQLSITDKGKTNKTALASLLFFVPFILVKPHYGLLPACVIAHRAFKTKSLRALMHADFVVLAMASLAYICSVYLFFPDFINEALPLSLSLYVNTLGSNDIHKFAFSMAFLAICITGISACSENSGDGKRLGIFIGTLAFLAVIPYWTQFKGFSLHLIPFNILAVTATGIMFCQYQGAILEKYKTAFLALAVLLSVSGTFLIAKNSAGLSHDFYRNHPLANILKPTGEEKSFYIESNSTNTVLQMAEYLDMEFASRFVANWFTFNLTELPEDLRAHYWQLLGDYYAQDLDRYEPETVLFVNKDDFYTVLETFKDHEDFQKAMSHYKLDGEHQSGELFFSPQKILGGGEISYYIFRRTEKEN